MKGSKQIPEELKDKFELIDNSLNGYYFSFFSDWLAKLFLLRFKFTPLVSGITGLSITLVFYIAAFIFHLVSGQDVAGLGINEVYIDFFYDAMMMTSVFYFYTWISLKSQDVFLYIQTTKTNIRINDYLNTYISSRINNPFIVYLSFIVALGLIIVIEYTSFTDEHYMWGTDKADFVLFRFFKVPLVWGLGYYMVIIIFIKQILIVWGMRTLCRNFNLIDNGHDESVQKILKIFANHNAKFSILIAFCGLGYVYLISRGMLFNYLDKDILVSYSFIIYILISIYFYLFPLHPFLDTLIKLLKKRDYRVARKFIRIIYLPSTSFVIAFLIPIIGYLII